MKKNYFKILGLSKEASDEDIKQRYRQLAHEHHPDKNDGNKTSEGRFKEIQEAYHVLKDTQRRENYLKNEGNNLFSDSYNTTPYETYDEMDRLIQEMYESFFDSYRQRPNFSRQSKSPGGNHVHYDLSGL